MVAVVAVVVVVMVAADVVLVVVLIVVVISVVVAVVAVTGAPHRTCIMSITCTQQPPANLHCKRLQHVHARVPKHINAG